MFAVAHAQRLHHTLIAGQSIPGAHRQHHCAHSAVLPRKCETVWHFKEVSEFLSVDNVAHVHHGWKVNSKGEHNIQFFCSLTFPFLFDNHEQSV